LLRRFAGTALLAAAGLSAACARAPAPPNVLLLTVDTLRADHVGAWGYPPGTSPEIDALVRESASFETALVPRGQTWPSLATLLTATPPVVHGVRRNGQPPAGAPATLATVLVPRGYRVAAFLANGGKAAWPGFEEVTDLRDLDGPLVARAKGWLRGHAGERFFLWVHLFAPHRPYRPPAPLARLFDPGYAGAIDGSVEQIRAIGAGGGSLAPEDVRHMIALYDGEVRATDRLVGTLLDALDELALADRTLVVLAADHGEELHERHGYFSHSASIYDTVLRVPLAFRWPGRIAAGPRTSGLAEAMDVAPTILGLAGIPRPAGWEGRDLSAVVRGDAAPDPGHAAFAELEDRVVSIRTREHRFVHNPSDFDFPLEAGELGVAFPLDREELYDHRADPAERRNVASAYPGVVRELRERVERWMDAHGWEAASARDARTRLPDDVRAELEALGYAN
jgi:arylsulfatase A-like enzyme